MTGLFWVTEAVAVLCAVLAFLGRIEWFWPYGLAAAAAVIVSAVALAVGSPAVAVYAAAIATGAFIAAWWYWRRRKRRRAPRTLGARSRARIAAMVTRMRERPARPALRPVPGGARFRSHAPGRSCLRPQTAGQAPARTSGTPQP